MDKKYTPFHLGTVVITPSARANLKSQDITHALNRHIGGDWGDVSEADRKENEFSIEKRLRLFSVYHAQDDTKFWIITEADRSATTVLLPEEY
jgi:hypothetical protein